MQEATSLQHSHAGKSQMRALILLLSLASLVAWQHPIAKANSDLALPAGLKAEGLPTVPSSVVEKAGRYTSSRSATLQSWHPSKREMLVTTRFGETIQVHQVANPMGDRQQLTFFQDQVQFASYHPGDGKYLVFLKDEGGNERDQLFRMDAESGEVSQLTFDKEPVTKPVWSTSGKWLLYSSAERTGQTMDVYLIDPLRPTQKRRIADIAAAYLEVWDVSPDDKKAIAYQYISSEETALWLIDVEAGSAERLTPASGKEKVAYWNAAFSHDGKGLFVTSDEGAEYSKLAYLDFTTKRIAPLAVDQRGDLESVALSRDGSRIAYVINEEGIGRLHLYNLKQQREESLPALPVGIVTNLQWRDETELGFNLETARFPADVYSLNVSSKEIERWTKSETGGLRTDAFPEAELIHWNSFDKRQISGFIYRPPAAKFSGPRPVLIDIHGGPQLQARPSYGGRYFYYTNELGMALIFPNVRGSAGFGKTFISLDNRELRGDAVKDLKALLDYVATRPDLDASRVMVRGDSYGGYLALSLAATEGQRIRGVMSVSGITSVADYVKTADAQAQGLLRVEYGDERDPQQMKLMEAGSPLINSAKIDVPLFLAAGKNDFRVPPMLTEKMVKAAQERGRPVWYLSAENEGHHFRRKNNRDYLFYASVLFIEKFVLN